MDKDVLTYREGRRQRQGPQPEQLTEHALLPRTTKILCGIKGYKNEGLWTIVSRRAPDIAVTN